MRGVGGQVLFFLLVLILAVPTASAASDQRGEALSAPGLLTNHDPILITGDSDFTPENGVIAGDGSPANPFVIAGWDFLVTGPPGIEIRNTTASFVLRDARLVENYDGAYDAVILRNVTNARIENVSSEFNRIGILLDGVRSVMVVGNQLHGNHRGIHVFSSSDVTIAGNSASGGPVSQVHFLVVDSIRVSIESNRIVPTYGTAIGADRSRDLRIVNNAVRSMEDGIHFDHVTDASVASNEFTWEVDNIFSGPGFHIESSSNVSLTANTFRDYRGDQVVGSSNIALDGNRLPGYLYGLTLVSSRDLVLTNNSMDRGGIRIAGPDVRDYDSHRIDPTNTVAGRPIAYLHDCADVDLSRDEVAQVIAVNCQRIRVANASFSHLAVGMHFLLSQQLIVENSSIDDAFEGVLAEASANLTVVNMSMLGGAFGIHLLGSQGFSVEDNRIRNFPQEISVGSSSDGQIVGNDLAESTNVALGVSGSQRVQLVRNNVTGNHWGIDVYGSTDVVVERNSVVWNEQGIVMDASQGVRVHHNEFLGNPVQARDASGLTNQWDDGYPSGGNFWSDYRGWDDCGGPAADVCPGSDGLGDIPYDLGGGVLDRFPLVPVNPPNELPVAAFSYAPASLAPGLPATFDARSSYDPEGWPLRYTWDFGDGTVVTIGLPTIDHAYSASQTFEVALTVTDPRGGTSNHTQAVVVGYRPVLSLSISPSNPRAGESVRFDASASYDPDGRISTFVWSLGDGSGYSPNAGDFWHIYESPGTYVVEVTATDDSGLSSFLTQTIVVGPHIPLVLVQYLHPSGFRLPIPEGWTVQTDVPVQGGAMVELVLLGPIRGGVQTNILVDTDEDPSVRETSTYLLGTANETILEVRQDNPSTSVVVMEGPSVRRIADHAAVTFKLQYGTGEFFQKIAIVVSEPHRRYWVLVLTTDGQSYPVMDEAFERMLLGFVITRALPPNEPPTTMPVTNPAGGILWLAFLGVGIFAAVLVAVLLIRSRRPPHGLPGIPSREFATLVSAPGGTPPVTIRFCPACGEAAPHGARFCGRCGVAFPLPSPGTSENSGPPKVP